jgi:protein-tyrosine phosphatase
VVVLSAGVHARDGAPACPEAVAWLDRHTGEATTGRHRAPTVEHASRLLVAEDVRAASLVLTAAREHRSAVARLVPAAQAYTFTLPQAARIAAWRSSQAVTPPKLPDGPARLAWLSPTFGRL